VIPAPEAVTVAVVSLVTAVELTAKVAVDRPASTVVLAGTVTADTLLERLTTVSVAAGLANVTVPTAAFVPVIPAVGKVTVVEIGVVAKKA